MSDREMRRLLRRLIMLNLVAFTVIVHFKAKEERTTALAAPETAVEATTEEETTEIELTLPTVLPTEEPTTAAETEEQTTEAPESIIPDYAAELIGRTIWGEAGGVASKAERAAVAWCILNRVDAWGISIWDAVTTPHQFYGYRSADKWGECPQEHIDLAADVLQRWEAERYGAQDVGRTLPSEYLYFLGDGERNHFTIEWKGTSAWDWSLTSPY